MVNYPISKRQYLIDTGCQMVFNAVMIAALVWQMGTNWSQEKRIEAAESQLATPTQVLPEPCPE